MSNNEENRSLISTNKWKYVPGKSFTLTPLNLQDIRKQLLDTSNEESEDSDENEEPQTQESKISQIMNKSFNAGSPCVNPKKGDIFKDNTLEPSINKPMEHSKFKDHNEKPTHKYSSFSIALKSVPEDTVSNCSITYSNDTTLVCENKENTNNNVEPLNLSRDKKKNDSFDLDFSALSLHTPIKKVERNFNYITPKINIIPPTETKASAIKSVSQFKTPNVLNRQYPFSKPLFRTPVNKPVVSALYSSDKKHGTPYSGARNPGVGTYSSSTENADINKVKRVIYSSEDGFDHISVNNIEYIVMDLLGKGGSSEVYCCFNLEEKVHVAIKLVSLSDHATAKGYINEVKLLESLQTCDRIIKMHDYEVRDEKLIVVLEKGGEDLSTIFKQLSTKQTHLPTHMLIFYWMEMLYAVKQIHQNGVIHSDLKPANFLRAEGGLKLIDFGIACKVQEDMTCVYKSNQEGSCNYISPEALSQQTTGNIDSPNYGKPKYKVHFKSDVWSLGCILYQLVYRKTPFHHINQIWAKLSAITDPNHKISFPKADWVPPKIINTIKKCLQYDTKLRPSVDELIDEYEQLLRKM